MRSVCKRSLSRRALVLFLLLLVALASHRNAHGAAQLTLTWTDNSDNEDGFKIERKLGPSGSFSQIATVGANGTSYVDSTLADGTTYCYRVRAYNSAGDSAYTNEACGTTPTIPSDTTPPVISAVAASGISSSGATITWTTNEPADTQVEYGLTTAYGSLTALNASLTTSHSQALSGLSPLTLYHYRVRSKDAAGNQAVSGDGTFTTLAAPAPADTTPPVISGVAASGITSSGATIAWTTNEPADTQVEYGLTTAYGSLTALNASLTTSHSQTLSGLSPSTLYHHRVRSRDAAGNLGVSADGTFTTLALPSGARTEEWGETPTSNHPGTVEDTYINLNTQNYSQATQLHTYTWPTDRIANAALLKWNLSAIPAGSTIQSATVYLYLEGYEGTGGDATYDISVHRIINKNPVIAGATGITYDGANQWTPNSCCSNGVPLAQADIATAEDVRAVGKTLGYQAWTVTQMVQNWVSNPSTNFGMMVNSDPVAAADSNRIFSSSEHAQASQRPKLVISYTPPAAPLNRPPVVNPITHNATDVDPSRPGLQIWQGTMVTYRGSATDPDGDPLTWEWRYTVDGGPEVLVASGSNPPTPVQDVAFTYASGGTATKTYVWILRASDGQATVQSSLTVEVLAPPAPSPAPSGSGPDPNPYGGCLDQVAPGGATGLFRVAKAGNRWMLVTPEGHAFWLRAVYGVDVTARDLTYTDALKQKYGSPTPIPWWTFVTQASRRLKSWGFNALGEHYSLYALPVGTAGRTQTNAEKLPFVRLIRISATGLTEGRFKNLFTGTSPSVYTGWRGGIFADVFDPAFDALAKELASDARGEFTAPGLAGSPWLIGTSVDDSNDVYGLGHRPGAVPGDVHPHLGWIAAVTAPTQNGATVYTKLAFRDFLRQKYQSLGALNAAWGSSYTSWDSNGGWPTGTGVLDESGQRAWIGRDFDRLSDTAPRAKADLDEFLEKLADKYFSLLAQAVRAYTPSQLVFSPSGIGAGARPQILRAAAQHLDVLQVVTPPDRLDLVREAFEVSGKPVFVWTTFQAQLDSPWKGRPGWGAPYESTTQAARGQAYSSYVQQLLALRAADGSYPVVGLDWWSWTDTIEAANGTDQDRSNFGLVTYRDNAYDGREAVMALGTDPWGYPTGGEQANYGNFLGAVTTAHSQLCSQLSQGPSSTSASLSLTNTFPAQSSAPASGSSSGSSTGIAAVDPLSAALALALAILALPRLVRRRPRTKARP